MSDAVQPSGGAPAIAPSAAPSFTPSHQPQAPQPPAFSPRHVLSGDDDDVPDVERFEISRGALKKRLERASRSELRKLFGTDSPDEILAWKAKADEFAKKEEQRKMASMTEAQRYKAQLSKFQKDAQTWEQKYQQLEQRVVVQRQDQQVSAITNKHVDPDSTDFVMLKLAQHIKKTDPKMYSKNPKAYVDRWIKRFVSANPKHGRAGTGAAPGAASASPPASGPRKVPVRRPITTGAGAGARPGAGQRSGVAPAKTLAPGQANSMTDAEAKEWMRKNGYTF